MGHKLSSSYEPERAKSPLKGQNENILPPVFGKKTVMEKE